MKSFFIEDVSDIGHRALCPVRWISALCQKQTINSISHNLARIFGRVLL